ncbi:MAG TPA: Glu/Leu/Phe/Val dehydrogenase [Bdellovibrionota bacterium]|nr:Glu/Leu/Phe/Val dehydrogenase [Bdellovibrionota bacterium]
MTAKRAEPRHDGGTELFPRMQSDGFEQVVFCTDRTTSLRAIIALHDLRLGPALGGTRFYAYPTEEYALTDALNLARAMTYKAALADLPLGGGKAVILGNPSTDKTPALLQAYGTFVDRLNGNYITTVDSGTSAEDMDVIRKTTRHVVGVTEANGGSGDPSPMTALGVAEGIRACSKFVFGSADLAGKRVAIQGLGHVGRPLAKRLRELGASLVVADTNRANLERATNELGAEVVDSKEIFAIKCDILAPCALGGVINAETIKKLKCRILAGAANNQLASEEIGRELHAREIVYAPDFAINAGGLIQMGLETDNFDWTKVETKTRNIFNTITKILEISQKEKRPTSDVAVQLAEKRLDSAPRKTRKS